MINDTVIKDYAEDYIINSELFNDDFDIDDFDIDSIVENLHHIALVNAMTIERFADCDAFPADDFVEAFEVNIKER